MNGAFRIVAAREEKRLDIFLADELAIPRSKTKRMIDEGLVTANGRAPKASAAVKRAMIIEGHIPPDEPLEATPEDIPLQILYEDEYLLAVNKEAGMVVHPACGHRGGTLVNAVLSHLGAEKRRNGEGEKRGNGETERGRNGEMGDVEVRSQKSEDRSQKTEDRRQKTEDRSQKSEVRSQNDYLEITNHEAQLTVHGSRFTLHGSRFTASETQNSKLKTLNSQPGESQAVLRPGIVHRLDKGTTGVILIAKNGATQDHLAALFKRRSMEKTYRAVVEGTVRQNEGTIEGNIGRHPIERKKMAVLTGRGREALTRFAVVERLKGFTVVEAYPRTGRTHQIRVHFSHMGHPVVGDTTYGKKARTLAPRPLLHAFRITFPHPATGEPLTIEAPIPRDMTEFIESHAL